MISAIVETTAKPKEKSSSSQLSWTTDYEVVSPYTVEQCIAQLNALTTNSRNKRPPFWNIIDFEFDSFNDNGGIVYFEILANTGKLAVNGKAVVQLIYQSENNTLVKVRIGLTMWRLILSLLWLPFINMLLLVGDPPPAWIILVLVMDIFLLILQIANCTALKPELYKTICETLAVPQASRPQTLPP